MKKNWIRIGILSGLLIVLLAFYLHKPQEERQAPANQVVNEDSPVSRFLNSIHYSMDIPEGMNTQKEGTCFAWVTDNGAGIMRNICLYSYPASRLDTLRIIRKRDSVMRINILGETDGMYMQTDHRIPVSHRKTAEGNVRTEGTWEMKGDMMGGPFVCYSIHDKDNNRIIVAEAFLFAPDRDKSVPMKRLEESLLTLRRSK